MTKPDFFELACKINSTISDSAKMVRHVMLENLWDSFIDSPVLNAQWCPEQTQEGILMCGLSDSGVSTVTGYQLGHALQRSPASKFDFGEYRVEYSERDGSIRNYPPIRNADVSQTKGFYSYQDPNNTERVFFDPQSLRGGTLGENEDVIGAVAISLILNHIPVKVIVLVLDYHDLTARPFNSRLNSLMYELKELVAMQRDQTPPPSVVIVINQKTPLERDWKPAIPGAIERNLIAIKEQLTLNGIKSDLQKSISEAPAEERMALLPSPFEDEKAHDNKLFNSMAILEYLLKPNNLIIMDVLDKGESRQELSRILQKHIDSWSKSPSILAQLCWQNPSQKYLVFENMLVQIAAYFNSLYHSKTTLEQQIDQTASDKTAYAKLVEELSQYKRFTHLIKAIITHLSLHLSGATEENEILNNFIKNTSSFSSHPISRATSPSLLVENSFLSPKPSNREVVFSEDLSATLEKFG